MLINVKIKKKKCFLSNGRTDRQRTTQNYSSNLTKFFKYDEQKGLN